MGAKFTDVTDRMVWPLVMMAGAFQLGMAQLLWRIKQPQSLEEKADLIGMAEAGRMLMSSKMEDVPDIIRRRMCSQFKIIGAVVLGILIVGIIRRVV